MTRLPASDHLKPNVWLSNQEEEKENSASSELNLYTLIDSVEKDIELLEQLGMFHTEFNMKYCAVGIYVNQP